MKPGLRNIAGKVTLLLICFFTACTSFSQSFVFGKGKTRWEAGINFGPSFFLGDLGGNQGKGTNNLKDLNLEFTKLMKGVFVNVYPNDWLGIRLAGDFTYLEGDDAAINTMGIDELWRKQRNLNFKTNVWEIYAGLEIYPLNFLLRHRENMPRLQPYGFLGVGMFHFNPKGSLTDASGNTSWYELHPLKTEGEGMSEYPESKPYKLTQMNIPMGAGIKFIISERFNFSTELLYRKTFTDYIDDVSKNYINKSDFYKYMSAPQADLASQLSDKTLPIIYPGMTRWPSGTQRGDNKNADTYFSIVAKIGIKLGPVSGDPVMRQTRCPSVY
ncbi:MAG: hypothetical protein U0X40_10195 [Ferruginibacter sp.]